MIASVGYFIISFSFWKKIFLYLIPPSLFQFSASHFHNLIFSASSNVSVFKMIASLISRWNSTLWLSEHRMIAIVMMKIEKTLSWCLLSFLRLKFETLFFKTLKFDTIVAQSIKKNSLTTTNIERWGSPNEIFSSKTIPKGCICSGRQNRRQGILIITDEMLGDRKTLSTVNNTFWLYSLSLYFSLSLSFSLSLYPFLSLSFSLSLSISLFLSLYFYHFLSFFLPPSVFLIFGIPHHQNMT